MHLAIAYNNNELVQDLIEAGANVNQRAIGTASFTHSSTISYIYSIVNRVPGSFFLPRDLIMLHISPKVLCHHSMYLAY